MPPIIIAVVGVAGAVAAATWIIKEARRVNAILHPEPAEPVTASAEDAPPSGPRLRPDATGVYRPESEG